jgi:hypothetical protein
MLPTPMSNMYMSIASDEPFSARTTARPTIRCTIRAYLATPAVAEMLTSLAYSIVVRPASMTPVPVLFVRFLHAAVVLVFVLAVDAAIWSAVTSASDTVQRSSRDAAIGRATRSTVETVWALETRALVITDLVLATFLILVIL